VYFTNPLQISSRDDKDWLQIVFLDNQKFTSQDGRMRLAKEATRLVFPLPLQMKNDTFSMLLADSESQIEYSMNAFVFVQVGINIVISVSLSQLLAMISSLNIIVFSSMIKTKSPANKQYVNGIFVGILGAEVIDPSWSTELMFNFEADEEFVNELLVNDMLDETSIGSNIFDLGFETFNPILNSGGFYIIYLFTLILMGIILSIKAGSYALKKAVKILRLPASNEGGEMSRH
jgi:hypothetical protein